MKPVEDIYHQDTDYKKIVLNFLGYKYYFAFVAFIALCLAFVVNKTSPKIFTNYATILISEQKQNAFMSSDDVMGGLGLFSGIQNVENEISLLSSYDIVNQAVGMMNMEVTYGYERNLIPLEFFTYTKDEELYQKTPVQIVFDQTIPQALYVKFFIDHINDSTYKLTINDTEVKLYNFISETVTSEVDSINFSQVFKYGEKVSTEFFNFTAHLDRDFIDQFNSNDKFFFYFNSIQGLTGTFKDRLSLGTASSTSSLVIISLSGTNPEKVTDFLKVLTQVYMEKNLQKKNEKAFNTVKFIDSRISDIADSLSYAENRLQNFRSNNQVMDMSFQGQKLYERMNALENEKVDIVAQQQYYDYIKEYFEKNDDVSDLVAPSSMGLQDPLMSNLIGQLLELNSERLNYLQETNTKNLFLKDLEVQINNLKSTIIENIDYNSNRAKIVLAEIESRQTKLNGQVSTLPKTERQLIGMERQFKLNDAIYTFLLQKRAEAQIARASNAPDYEIVENPLLFRAAQISPRSGMNYAIALFLGLLIPFVVILLKDFFNNKVRDLKEIEGMTDLSIIGQVHHNRTKSTAIIKDYPKSPLADSFRSIRTNLQFFSNGVDKMTILITSSMSGEGKSFCSVNLASVYALLGKKTVLIGFDLRRPALFDDFELKNEKGITSYLIRNAQVDEIIQKTQIENLDLISAGPIPPNPVELIASSRTDNLFEELKKRYDYVIIDSAPIGAVTDSFLLFKYANVNVFTLRHNFTNKDDLKVNLKSIMDKNFKNVALIINDIAIKKNSYGYSYESRYYSDTKKMSKIRKMFASKRA